MISDEGQISAGHWRDVRFRVVPPGAVKISSAATGNLPRPTSGEPQPIGSLLLFVPGTAQPVARKTAQLPATSISLSHQATQAELAALGDWTCEIDSEFDLRWVTVISGDVMSVPPPPLHSASFDIDLLNLMVAELITAAAVRVHLESTADQSNTASYVAWSSTIATEFGIADKYFFHVDDPSKSFYLPATDEHLDLVWRISGLDSAPSQPQVDFLSATMSFVTPVTWKCLDSPFDILIYRFELGFQISFKGMVTPICSAGAWLAANDVSSDVQSGLLEKLNARIHDEALLAPDNVRSYLDNFFGRLLRLEAEAQIQAYRVDGNSLVVDYTLPVEPPVVPVVHPVGPPVSASPH